jgi:hypothetical protein
MAHPSSTVTLDPKLLAEELMRLEREQDVVDLLDTLGLWGDDTAWQPYGGNESNQSIIGTQQSDAFAALTEKIINCVDAYLIMACLLAGIDPESDLAPATMEEGVRRFGHLFTGQSEGVRVREAYEHGVDSRELTELARQIAVVVTGPKGGEPGISIIDQALGQTPDTFVDTFLSLMKGNKQRIKFVQGKFNMGGSGALRFCSEQHHLQLLISRRNPALVGAGATDRDRMWGVTIIRKRPAREGERMSVYEYLAPRNAVGAPQILAFAADSMPILPSEKTRQACAEPAKWGTLNKLYQYRWPASLASHSTQIQGKSMTMHLNINLPDAVMPVRVYELRGYEASNPTMNVYGLRARFEQNDDVKARLEVECPVVGTLHVRGYALPVRAYVFQFGDARMSTYRGDYGVIFSLNGQKHGHLAETFFARRDVDLGILRAKTVVVVDCDGLDTHAREQILMNSRDRLAESQLAAEVRDQLASWLKDNPVLALLKRRHIEAELNKAMGEDLPLAELMRKLVRDNPDLAALFRHGSRIPVGPGGGDGVGAVSDFVGKDDPTYFRFRGGKEHLSRTSPQNHVMNVDLETDAVNDYLSRTGARKPGIVTIVCEHPSGDKVTAVVGTLHDGCLQVRVKHPTAAKAGDEYKVRFVITDPNTSLEFVNVLEVKVLADAEVGPSGTKGRRKAQNTGDKGGAGSGGIELPRLISVRKDQWESYGWNDATALDVQLLDGKAEAFRINMDNRYLDLARRKKPRTAALLERRFQFGLAFLAVAVIANEEQARAQVAASATELMSVEDVVRVTMSAVAQSVLPVIDVLGRLTERELADLVGDDEVAS